MAFLCPVQYDIFNSLKKSYFCVVSANLENNGQEIEGALRVTLCMLPPASPSAIPLVCVSIAHFFFFFITFFVFICVVFDDILISVTDG